MPLFYQHNINDNTKLAVWHITESEYFFLEKVPLQTEVSHPHKRLQHLAARYLLEILQPGFPFHLIEIADSKKPLLSNEEFHFSVSHCGDYAAAIVSENNLVGIDVELVTQKIKLVKERFLRGDEINLLPDPTPELLTLFWSAKEAIYKWYGKGKASFKNNMSLNKLSFENEQGFINAHFEKDERTDLIVEFRFFENLCLAWV
ncbi:MAG: 4'-phosphopantetheinyl transferase superfamily protein [Bacteroidota bacterium]|nr:4'-phosphopantetheinyl transferase superfamily protein [Bacteroidota bacterium]